MKLITISLEKYGTTFYIKILVGIFVLKFHKREMIFKKICGSREIGEKVIAQKKDEYVNFSTTLYLQA